MKQLILMFVLMTTSFAANSLDIRGDANVFSGKITTCVEAAKEVKKIIQEN